MHRARNPVLASLTLALVAAHGGPAAAQDSRAATVATEQAEKAKTLQPYVPAGLERRILQLKHEFLDEPSGFYPYFGSVYSGGGFTLYSLKSYKLLEVSTDSWGHAGGKLDLHARAGWRDATQIAFHGIGIDSPSDLTNFRMKQGYVGGDARVRPGGYTVAGAGLSYEDFTLDEGTGVSPSIEDVFTPLPRPPASTGGRRRAMRAVAAGMAPPITTTPTATMSTASTGSTPRSSSTYPSFARTGCSRSTGFSRRRWTTMMSCRIFCCLRSGAAARSVDTVAGAFAIGTAC
jgi:hypothetical protein